MKIKQIFISNIVSCIRFLKYIRNRGYMRGIGYFFYVRGNIKNGFEKEIFSIDIGLLYPLYMRKKANDYAIFEQVFVDKQYEIDYLISDNNLRVIDAGANVGMFCVYIKNKFPSSSIVCVEPEANNFTLLEKNTSCYSSVTLLEGGIWSYDTRLKITNPNAGNAGFRVKEAMKGGIKAYGIHDIMKKMKRDHIDILKIDIEGSEHHLMSDETFLEQWIHECSIIIIEPHERIFPGITEKIYQIAEKYSYRTKKYGENILLYSI